MSKNSKSTSSAYRTRREPQGELMEDGRQLQRPNQDQGNRPTTSTTHRTRREPQGELMEEGRRHQTQYPPSTINESRSDQHNSRTTSSVSQTTHRTRSYLNGSSWRNQQKGMPRPNEHDRPINLWSKTNN